MRFVAVIIVGIACIVGAPAALAAVSGADAAALQGRLTPMGAQRAGNADATIPAWTGAVTPADPDGHETPVLTIDAANAPHFAARLPAGALAMFARFPDYRMKVFPTHRTGVAPAWVYANVARNATQARPAPEGIRYGVAGAAGGVPFPIPADGTQVVWNHLLAFWGAAREAYVRTYVASGDGSVQLSAAYRETTDFPYYSSGDSPGRYYFKTKRLQTEPAARAGEAYIAWQPLDTARDKYVAWRYLPGEHRVRKAPSLSYDTPDPDSSGYESMDDYYLFFGGPDRYDFRLLGKREMYIPYNNDRVNAADARDVMDPHHANQDRMRYELHRVWVVDGTLAAGEHHVAPHRRLYIDEDTWLVVYSEAWDEDGKLWKFGEATMTLRPEIPAVIIGGQFVYDLLQGGYCYDFSFGGPGGYYRVVPPHPTDTFDAGALAAGALK